jgi:hypothetical protein
MYKPIARTFVERISCLYKDWNYQPLADLQFCRPVVPVLKLSHKAKLNLVLCDLAGVCFPAALRPTTVCMRLIRTMMHTIFRCESRDQKTSLCAHITSRYFMRS